MDERHWWQMLFPFYPLPFVLDETRTKDTRFSARSADPWSVLRSNYTGPRLLFHLLFLGAFLLPYVARTIFWVGVNQVEARAVEASVRLVRRVTEVAKNSRGSQVRAWVEKAERFCEQWGAESLGSRAGLRRLREAKESLGRLLRELETLAGSEEFASEEWVTQGRVLLEILQPLVAARVEERTVAEVVLGLDQGLWYVVLVGVLVLYNVGRGALTYCVGPLREEEDRSGDSPAREDYWWFYRVHQVMALLFLVVAAAFVVNAWYWLSRPVLVPA
jgi:hypothetical protein